MKNIPIKSVLLVDDEENVLLCSSRTLTHHLKDNYELTIFTSDNSIEALGLCESKRPDVIVTDIRRPVMGGAEFCGIVRQKFPEVRILVYTMSGRQEVLSLLEHGIVDLVRFKVAGNQIAFLRDGLGEKYSKLTDLMDDMIAKAPSRDYHSLTPEEFAEAVKMLLNAGPRV